jgi:hypothetical protein
MSEPEFEQARKGTFMPHLAYFYEDYIERHCYSIGFFTSREPS